MEILNTFFSCIESYFKIAACADVISDNINNPLIKSIVKYSITQANSQWEKYAINKRFFHFLNISK